ncbi:MAG TPA: heme biosynthesis HemY N-terminal domain-containing protein, partial [Stellaceae bacterium]|nr:heme biosynthesis HemY N-terminal domain-containing protein [Stellaceae bacterium]
MRVWLSILVVLILVTGAVFVADRPGSVSIVWEAWRLDTSVAVLALGTAFVALAVGWLYVMLRKIFRAPRNFVTARRDRKRRDGYRALTYGLAAVAAGDAIEAQRHARRAEKLLATEKPLTLLLSAQAAQLAGDEDGAKHHFAAMLNEPETVFLGLRGLIARALKTGDEVQALKLIERAQKLKPRTPWVLRGQYELLARAKRWDEADMFLAEAIRTKAVNAEEGRHHRAALLHERGRSAQQHGRARDALDLAARAHALDPGFAPATAWYAELLEAAGKHRRARKTIEAAWRIAPHPDLARAYGALYADESELARVKRFERLAEINPGHVESHVAQGHAALKARLWGEARRHLQAAGSSGDAPPPRLCRLMAEIEEKQNNDLAASRAWLERA